MKLIMRDYYNKEISGDDIALACYQDKCRIVWNGLKPIGLTLDGQRPEPQRHRYRRRDTRACHGVAAGGRRSSLPPPPARQVAGMQGVQGMDLSLGSRANPGWGRRIANLGSRRAK